MEMFYYRCSKPNFGDELNHWMWPRLLDGVWERDDQTIFIGIGSVINDQFPADQQKIVFGAGYGGYTALPEIDDRWRFYFVRGKLTARRLGLDEKLAIGDAAILLRSCVGPQPAKRHRVSFMPHWETTLDGNWALACELAGFNYIDPCDSVDVVLEQLRASELVITEAMHGAIVSDALRVPWVAAEPLVPIHRMKWHDWASALAIDLRPATLTTSSLLESAVLHFRERRPGFSRRLQRRRHLLKPLAANRFAQRAADRLTWISRHVAPTLSTDHAISNAHEQMLEKLEVLLSDLGRGRLLAGSPDLQQAVAAG